MSGAAPIGRTIASVGMDGEAYRRVAAAWDSVPPDKRARLQGAYAVLCAARRVDTPPLTADIGEKGLIYWRAGHGHLLITAVDAYAAAFCGGREADAVREADGCAAWFVRNGILATARPTVAEALPVAKRYHDAGLELERLEKAAAPAPGRREKAK